MDINPILIRKIYAGLSQHQQLFASVAFGLPLTPPFDAKTSGGGDLTAEQRKILAPKPPHPLDFVQLSEPNQIIDALSSITIRHDFRLLLQYLALVSIDHYREFLISAIAKHDDVRMLNGIISCMLNSCRCGCDELLIRTTILKYDAVECFKHYAIPLDVAIHYDALRCVKSYLATKDERQFDIIYVQQKRWLQYARSTNMLDLLLDHGMLWADDTLFKIVRANASLSLIKHAIDNGCPTPINILLACTSLEQFNFFHPAHPVSFNNLDHLLSIPDIARHLNANYTSTMHELFGNKIKYTPFKLFYERYGTRLHGESFYKLPMTQSTLDFAQRVKYGTLDHHLIISVHQMIL